MKKAQSAKLVIDEDQTLKNVEEWYEIHRVRQQDIGVEPLPKAMFTGALNQMIPNDKGRFFFEADVTDRERVMELVRGVDVIYHLAISCLRTSLNQFGS